MQRKTGPGANFVECAISEANQRLRDARGEFKTLRRSSAGSLVAGN